MTAIPSKISATAAASSPAPRSTARAASALHLDALGLAGEEIGDVDAHRQGDVKEHEAHVGELARVVDAFHRDAARGGRRARSRAAPRRLGLPLDAFSLAGESGERPELARVVDAFHRGAAQGGRRTRGRAAPRRLGLHLDAHRAELRQGGEHE